MAKRAYTRFVAPSAEVFRYVDPLAVQQAHLESHATRECNHRLVEPRPYSLQLCPAPGARILDVGAYLGPNLLYYAHLGFEIVGVEAAMGYCATFASELKKQPRLSPRPAMLNGMIETVKIPGRFQAILCGEMICYCPDPEPAMQRMTELCDPGGVLLITVPKEPQQEFPTHFSLLELERFVVNHGFRPVLTDYLRGWGAAWVSAVRAIKEET